MGEQQQKLTGREVAAALYEVGKTTFRASPLTVVVKLIGAVVTAVLPIITTFYAAQTTTALAQAYAGDEAACTRALLFVGVTAGLGVLLVVWVSVEQYINQLVRYRIDAAISDQLYEQFLSLEFWRYDDRRTIDLYDRAKAFSNFFGYAFDSLARIAGHAIAAVAGTVALLLVSWWIGLIIIAAVIPGVLLQIRLSRQQTEHWSKNLTTRRTQMAIEHSLTEVRSIAELRVYGMVRNLLNLRHELRDQSEKGQIELERRSIMQRLAADAVEAAAEVLALVYIALQIIAHAQPIGQFLYVQQILSRALGGFRGLTAELNAIDQDVANLFSYRKFMELPRGETRSARLTSQPKLIAIENVSFQYSAAGGAYALRNVSLTVEQGQHVAIVGENGAGKSTLVKILLGLYQPSSGVVQLDGVDLQTIDLASWHAELGVLQQAPLQLLFAAARDNVSLGDVSIPFSDERYQSALKRAEVGEFIARLPLGADTYLTPWMEHEDGSSGVDLSGGQWQRLALARSFYRDSPIIILDEPTSAIDALAESRIFERLFDQADKTIITISHRLTTVERADVIYMLEDGSVVETGTHAELVAMNGAYVRMFKSQLR